MTKRWMFIIVACVGLNGSLSAADVDKGYEAPVGLTLQAKVGGRYLLLWDNIESNTLMGYSVWLRRKGEREFVRLSVPVKVGKEIQKQPMISESKLELKLGENRKDLEFSVVGEYEDGPGARSESVFSAKARVVEAPNAPLSPVVAIDGTQTAKVELATPMKADPYAEDDNKPAPVGPAPWDQHSSRLKRPLLTPPRKVRTTISASFELIRSVYGGKDPMHTLGLLDTGIPPNNVVTWKRIDTRTRFVAPLKAEVGLLEGLELWAEASYHAEDVSINTYDIDGTNYNYIRYVNVLPDGSYFFLPDPSSTGFGDTLTGLRIQPLSSQPLVLGLQASFPTGKSRLVADLDWEHGRAFGAGTGEGITRLTGQIDWGWRGLRPGPSMHGSFSPGDTERFREKVNNTFLDHAVYHGDVAELGVAYTIPWNVLGRDGAIVPYGNGRSVGASRWSINGTDYVPYIDKIERSRLAAHTLLKFHRDDQLELGVEAVQDLPGGFETGGRFAYTTGVFGDQWLISGRLAY